MKRKRATKPRSRDKARRWLRLAGAYLATVTVLGIASWVRPFNIFERDRWPLEYWVEKQAFAFAERRVETAFSPDIVLILGDGEGENGTFGKPGIGWRRHHARLIRALAGAGARLVAFDLFFDDASDADADLADAVSTAVSAGTEIVVGTRLFLPDEDGKEPNRPAALAKAFAGRWAMLSSGVEPRGTRHVDRIRLAQPLIEDPSGRARILEVPVMPSLPLAVAARVVGPGTKALYLPGAQRVQLRDGLNRTVKSIPVDGSLHMFIKFADAEALRTAEQPYHEVLERVADTAELRRKFNGKIVLVGYRVKEDLFTARGDVELYGVQIQASAISNILQGIYVRILSWKWRFLLIVLMALAGVVIRLRFGKLLKLSMPLSRIPIPLPQIDINLPVSLVGVAIAYLALVVFPAYKYWNLVLDFTYAVVALFAAHWVIGYALEKEASQ